MKGSVLVVVSLVLAVGAGFGGGFAAATFHDSSGSAVNSQVPAISSFKILRPVIENGSGFEGHDLFTLNASESGTPYEAGYQVVLVGYEGGLTLASGSFFGDLNFESISLLGVLIIESLPVGNYTLVAMVMHGDLSNSRDASLEVLPSVSATISGPHNVNDSSGAVTATYHASVTGGSSPYSYTWSITYINGPNPQNYALGSVHGSSFNVKFSVNTSNDYYGTNQTFVIGLTVTDSLGYSFSYKAQSIYGNEGYLVNVTGE